MNEQPDPLLVVRIDEEDAGRSLSVVLSDGTVLQLAAEAKEARDIVPGLPLSEEAQAALLAADERKRIAKTVFGWLDRRPRTRMDLRQRLLAKGHAPDVVDATLDQFEAQGLIDDRAFAEQFARERLRNRPVGPRWLLGRLRQEGVEGQVVQQVVKTVFEEEDEAELAVRALRGRRLDLSSEAGRGKAARFLSSRGFGAQAAVRAVGELKGR